MRRLVQRRGGGVALASAREFGLAIWSSGLLGLGVMGCASPGPPRAPSLQLPAVVTGLHAERRGGDVVLQFAAPMRSTDGFLLKAPVTVAVCRAVGDGKCVEVGRKAVAGAVEWVDALPAALAGGPVRKLAYQIEVFNDRGRSAGRSAATVTAAGDAPRAVVALRAEGSKAGVRLLWAAESSPVSGGVLVERKDLSAAAGARASASKSGKKITVPIKTLPGRKKRAAGAPAAEPGDDPDTVWLRAEAPGLAKDSGGTVDDTAVADGSYRYRAVRMRVVTVGGMTVEMRSAESPAVEFTLRDLYPPAVPQRLAGAAFAVEGTYAVAVDLIWQPVPEADVAGYDVYRASGTGGTSPLLKLTAKPVALPSFHDVGVERGMTYRYAVTAVDAKGNASAMSDAAQVETPPK